MGTHTGSTGWILDVSLFDTYSNFPEKKHHQIQIETNPFGNDLLSIQQITIPDNGFHNELLHSRETPKKARLHQST